jgi:hypothetical protein
VMTREELMKEDVDKLMAILNQVRAYEQIVKEVLRIKVNEKPK